MSEEHTAVFWDLIARIRAVDPRVQEGTIMGARCARVDGEFLALVDFKGSGLVVKLPAGRVAELVVSGVARPFAPAGRVFREWASIPDLDVDQWLALLEEGVDFVG
jgi:hypothetical protein